MVDTKSPGDKTLSVRPDLDVSRASRPAPCARASAMAGPSRWWSKARQAPHPRRAPATETPAAEPAPSRAGQGAADPSRDPAAPPPAPVRRGAADADEDERTARALRARRRHEYATSIYGAWRKRKPSAATAGKASSSRARASKPAARPKRSATARTKEAKRKAELEAKKRFGEAEARAATTARAVPDRAGARHRRRYLRRGRRSSPDPSRPRRALRPRRRQRPPPSPRRKSSAALDPCHRAQCR